MSNCVAEMPIYIQHQNPKVIKIVIKKLVQLLKIEIDVSDLSLESTYFEKKDRWIGPPTTFFRRTNKKVRKKLRQRIL